MVKHYTRYGEPYEYRNGPVPGTRCFRGGCYFHRKIGHYKQALIETDICRELVINLRGKRRRHNIPNDWDDLPRSDWGIKSWKNYRKTQYK